jgi:putative membrane protein insertion efficiency factor
MSAIAGLSRLGRFLVQLPGHAFIGLIRVYQRTLSPVLPVITLGRCACRFAPTCSHYAVEAIATHGAVRGAGLAFWRLARCTPLSAGGFDPVPPRRRPSCARAARASTLASALTDTLTPLS